MRETKTRIVVYIEAGAQGAPAGIAGKFLQLRWRGQEHLIFSQAALDGYHTQILARFLEESDIPHHRTGKQALVVDSPDIVVIGGGRFRVDQGGATLDLWDNSQAFGRFDERGLAGRIAAADHPWKRFSVNVA
ncbi:MAG: hypothetical protein A2V83_11665 [Nitrospirae bacterium RBG_16_64_22]|nr:MAG: hypothetical protein A2V83_11665 [Nitrospirae bacterium RBG_16_64_22]